MVAQSKITLAGPAGTLEGMLHLPDSEPVAIAVVAHPLPTMGGTMDNKIVTTLAKTFAELGFATLRFNFRGVGSSEGIFDSGNGEVEDALAVVQHARDAFGHLPLILAGFSFGGYVAARAAQHLHPGAHKLVLVGPAVGRFAMPAVPHNTLVIHGEHDEIIPLAEALDWARPHHLPVVVLPEAGHFLHGRLQQLKQIVLREFKGCRL
jgi:alpha/beta superfamily hydrolase